MINEDRVRQMTKIALFEEYNSKKFAPMLKSDKKSFVSSQMLKSFFADTCFYVILCAAVYMGITNITGGIVLTAKLLLLIMAAVLYVIFIVFHLSMTKKKALMEYKRGRKMIKALYDEYGKLGQMYEKKSAPMRRKIE